MPPTKTEDLNFGLKSEEKNKATLEDFFRVGLKKTGTYDPMDYVDEAKTIFIEMKTRRINHNQYPTALIGKNKVDFCKTSNATCYFVYVYLDGMFYVKYDDNLFNTFECADFERGWREGGIQPKQLFYYIPHEHLTPLATTSNQVNTN
jgi:hypothetical protein